MYTFKGSASPLTLFLPHLFFLALCRGSGSNCLSQGNVWSQGCPSHPPTLPTHLTRQYPTRYNPIRLLRWLDAGPDLQNSTSAVWFQVPSFKNRSTRPARRENNPLLIQAFRRVFQQDLADFSDQNTRSGDSGHDLGGKSIGFGEISARSSQIASDLGRIGRDLADFLLFLVVSSGFQLHPKPTVHPMGNRPIKPNLWQFGCGLDTFLPDLRQVGCRLGTNPTRPTCGQPYMEQRALANVEVHLTFKGL